MIQKLLLLLPHDGGSGALRVAFGGAAIGAVLWLAGARFSRSLIALLAVAAGAMLGMFLPRWLGWSINGMATTVGGAIFFGILGYGGHRAWVAAALGVVLAAWATLAAWVICPGSREWTWPAFSSLAALPEYATQLWRVLPPNIAKVLPYVAGAGLLSGVCIAALWPRLGIVLLYSTLGLTLLLGTGLFAAEVRYNHWLAVIPAATWMQVITLCCLVAFGAVVQWRLAPAAKPIAPPPEEPKDKK